MPLGPDLDLVLEVALDRARDVARQLARDPARDLGDVSEFARGLDPDLNPNPAAGLALDLGCDLALALDRALGTDRDRVLSLDLALDLALAFDRALACERTFDLARGVACVVGLSRAAGSGRGRDLVRALSLALCYALALALILNLCALAELVRGRDRGFATQIEVVNMHHQRISTCILLMTLVLGLVSVIEDRAHLSANTRKGRLQLLRTLATRGGFGGTNSELPWKVDSKDEMLDAITFARTASYLAFAFKRSRLTGEDLPFEALRIVREHVGTTQTKAKF